MTDPTTKQERVRERSTRLYEDGYRAAPIPDTLVYFIITPGGDPYIVDPVAQSCTCAFFPLNGYCKHAYGLTSLLRAQNCARKARRELRQQAGAAPIMNATTPGPAPEFPLVPASQAQETRKPRKITPQEMDADFGAAPADSR